jgi:hypothetical protein
MERAVKLVLVTVKQVPKPTTCVALPVAGPYVSANGVVMPHELTRRNGAKDATLVA